MNDSVPSLSSNWKALQKKLAESTVKEAQSEQPKSPNGTVSLTEPSKRKRNGQDAFKPRKKPKQKANGHASHLNQRPPSMQSSTPKSNPTAPNPSKPLDPKHAQPQTISTDAIASAGKYIGLDCEMIGLTNPAAHSIPARTHNHHLSRGSLDQHSILARVTLVDYHLRTVYDAYVLPPDVPRSELHYRTQFSGITSWHLHPKNTTTTPQPFDAVQAEVRRLLKDRVVVGHGLETDLRILGLKQDVRRWDVRDTAAYPKFKAPRGVGGGAAARKPALKYLARDFLGWSIQEDARKGHDSAEDARAAMSLFKLEKEGFEREVKKVYGKAMSGAGVKAGGKGVGRTSAGLEVDGAELVDSEEEDGAGHEDRGTEVEDEQMQDTAHKKSGKKKRKRNKKKPKHR